MTRRPLPEIPHAGVLPDWDTTPPWVLPDHSSGQPANGLYSCSFCGVGDSGRVSSDVARPELALSELPLGEGVFTTSVARRTLARRACMERPGELRVFTDTPLCEPGSLLRGEITIGEVTRRITAREVSREDAAGGMQQSLVVFRRALSVTESSITDTQPTSGCVKLKLSTGRQQGAFPIHLSPSVLEPDGSRRAITYDEAVDRLAELLLRHRQPVAKTLIYASGQLDYFSIFAVQEVFRLLGVRNLTGNAEHCLNAGAVHNEILTGQEGPFLTIGQSVEGPNRVYLLNGWNGFITHPPVFAALMKRPDFDGFLIEVMVTETAKAVAKKLGPDRVLLIRPRSDPQLALGIAHEIFTNHASAIEERFIKRFADRESFARFRELAMEARFAPERVAMRIAPEPQYVERLRKGMRMLAHAFCRPGSVPINIPSVGLSQTSGVVAHCLWGSVLAMLGKYGLHPGGQPAGGTLRVPGQINAESEVQGLSRKYFMGRVPISEAADAASRLGLPDDAYQRVVDDAPRAALDYSDPTPHPELFLCLGTQFEANMMGRNRWLRKLEDPNNTLVVIDPIPDPYTLANAALIIPSPPHVATTKLYQNGEWKLSLSIPQKQAATQTRSDATIIYDVMARITQRLADPQVRAQHPDLARHYDSGYLARQFCLPEKAGAGGLTRVAGEVSRPELWDRIQRYMSGGRGPLYCRPEHKNGEPIRWEELLERPLVYGGVGETRYVLDYDDPDALPFSDIFRRPASFKFFVPTARDLEFPAGIILNSGRSSLSDDRTAIQFATSTFNSGKATPIVDMPDNNPLFVSPSLAERFALSDGGHARIINRHTGDAIVLPVVVSERVKGDTVYTSFHKSRAKMLEGLCVNTVTSHEARCSYSGQTEVKATQVLIEAADAPRVDTTLLDPRMDVPIWNGQDTRLYVTDIIEETHDVFTFRFQGKPLCRFVYYPGQFCSLVLNIDGKKVVRSYSISSSPARPYVLEITVKRVPGGLVSNWLPDNLRIGDRVEVTGPKGKFFMAPGKIPKKVLLLGAGSGVTPMMSMARWLCDVSADVDVKFFNSVRSPDDIIYREEIEALATRFRQFDPMVVTTTRNRPGTWVGLKGRISKSMLDMIATDLHERHVFMCGPQPFMDAVKEILREVGYDLSCLHMESFGGVRTSVRDKAAPVGAESSSEPETTGDIPVGFSRSGKKVQTDGRLTLLEVAEAHDVPLDYACRAGSCGECKARLLSGEVDQASDEGLTAAEKEQGYILTCVSTPKGPCEIDC